jgi:hypothetical protein
MTHTRRTQRDADRMPLISDLTRAAHRWSIVVNVLMFAGGFVTAILLRVT